MSSALRSLSGGQFIGSGTTTQLAALLTHPSEIAKDIRGEFLFRHTSTIRNPVTKSKDFSIDIREGVTYTIYMKSKAPISAETPTGAVESNTAEAASDPQTQYPAFGCGTQGRFHDLPFLPDRM